MTRADHAMLKEIGRVSSLERERDHYRDALREIAKHGCGLGTFDPRTWCRRVSDDPDNWCWCCFATAALEEMP